MSRLFLLQENALLKEYIAAHEALSALYGGTISFKHKVPTDKERDAEVQEAYGRTVSAREALHKHGLL